MHERTVHNPDRYMVDLRQILSQGRKRIGLLIGAGAPVSIKVNVDNRLDPEGKPLIPNVKILTTEVIGSLHNSDKSTIVTLLSELGTDPNIETELPRVS